MYQTTVEIFGSMPSGFLEALSGVFFLVLVGKVTGSELRLTLAGVAACLAFPHPATLYGVALFGVIFRILDFVWLPMKGVGNES